jgi:ubiquinone/menaquinone biosynthesis C-methylase UbiE
MASRDACLLIKGFYSGSMPVAPTPYYGANGASTRFYDLVTAADPALSGDVALYASLVPAGAKILELGTGTGRVAIALAEQGFCVTGIDIAPAMLSQAEAKAGTLAPAAAARLRFVRGDLTALSLPDRFDAIFATYFTLAHLPPATSWKRALAGMARHLHPGGLIALHLPIAEQMAAPPPPPDRPVLHQPLDGGQQLTLFVAGKTARSDRMTLLLDYVVQDAVGAEVARSRESLTYFMADPGPYAERAGFARARAPIPLGKSGHIHIFEKPRSSGKSGADDGT